MPENFKNREAPKNLPCGSRNIFWEFRNVISGATLKGENAVVTWNPAEKEEEEYPERANKLILKQILLGVEAKADEYNVVEVRVVYFNLKMRILGNFELF